MSPNRALVSMVHLFVVFFFFIGGCFFVSIPYAPQIKDQIFESSTRIGFSLLVVSLLLLIAFYSLETGRYLVIRMNVKTNLQIVHETLEDCFARHFPQKIHLMDVEIGPKSILEIQVSLPPASDEAREDLFIEVEKHLSILFRERFGYSKQFRLIAKL